MVLTPGNHDSARRLGFASGLLRDGVVIFDGVFGSMRRFKDVLLRLPPNWKKSVPPWYGAKTSLRFPARPGKKSCRLIWMPTTFPMQR